MAINREEKQRIATCYATRKRSRLAQLKYAREQRRKPTGITGGRDSAVASGSDVAPGPSGSMAVAEPGDVDVCTEPGAQHSVGEPSIASSSQSDQRDVDGDGEVRPPLTDDSCLFGHVASLKIIVKNIPFPICQGHLTVVVVDKTEGPVVGLRNGCTSCATSTVRRCLQASLVIVAASLPLPQQGGWWQVPWTVVLGFPDTDGFVGGWFPPAFTRRPT